eukprot:4541218-Amphidinium_carterae.1
MHASRNAAYERPDGLIRRPFRSFMLLGLDRYKCDHRVGGCAWAHTIHARPDCSASAVRSPAADMHMGHTHADKRSRTAAWTSMYVVVTLPSHLYSSSTLSGKGEVVP